MLAAVIGNVESRNRGIPATLRPCRTITVRNIDAGPAPPHLSPLALNFSDELLEFGIDLSFENSRFAARELAFSLRRSVAKHLTREIMISKIRQYFSLKLSTAALIRRCVRHNQKMFTLSCEKKFSPSTVRFNC